LLELEINVLAGRLVEPEIYRDAADRAEGREIDGQEKLPQPRRQLPQGSSRKQVYGASGAS